MKVLVTGANGFIGKNLVAELKNKKLSNVFEFDVETDLDLLDVYCKEADFIFHLAGVNRPKCEKDFEQGNYNFTKTLLDKLKIAKNTCPVMFSSSIQAELNNPYGKSKKAAETLLYNYNKDTSAKVLIYRFPNVFGKWCKPNYNSVIATFCNNIVNDIPIVVNDPKVIMKLVYIDDVVDELISALVGKENRKDNFCEVPVIHNITLGDIVDLLYSFKRSRIDYFIPDMSNPFTKKLYSTYLSYLPQDKFSYSLKMNTDHRGSFTEFIKTYDRGQFSINVSKPGMVKGNHWHNTKNEKFLVLSGKGVVQLRKIDSDIIIKYYVSGDNMEVIDIPVGYTHNIKNIGDNDMVTLMWANEPYDPEKPDTYYFEV